ncbi:hypothetical protein AWJ20_3917 [Sugiyamaella lignohabitans]|uniref:Lipid droplet-associated hydrolase n=1 Tax=Sugiyamaella lignohabitans TaxID=796027 RepID=A0A167C1W7_9ASCO|nr:uncharacterized protein AWJ20_3917 [Sugiyamaella lignohabitans]ANB11119.1 hypothetical protein AWJ20_3917 [Sugiyamaella lignohabitans]
MGVIILDGTQLEEPVSAYHIPGDKGGPLFILIPGNPGVCQYYSEYLDELKGLLPSYEFLCASHRGMDALLNPKGSVGKTTPYKLTDQVEHLCNVLEWATARATSSDPRDVIIMGHSMGAWLLQRVLVRFANSPKIRFKMAGLLTPTIRDLAGSPKGVKLSWILDTVTQYPGYVMARTVQALYKTLPNFAFGYAIKLGLGGWSSTPSHAIVSTIAMLSRPSILVQVGQLAADEISHIKSDLPEFWDASIATDRGFAIWAYFAQNDPWVSDTTRDEIISEHSHLPSVHFDIAKGDPEDAIAHSFCLRQSSRFARITAYRISITPGLEPTKPQPPTISSQL